MAQSPPTQKLHICNPVKDDANNISSSQLCIDDINGIRPKYDHKYRENGQLLKNTPQNTPQDLSYNAQDLNVMLGVELCLAFTCPKSPTVRGR